MMKVDIYVFSDSLVESLGERLGEPNDIATVRGHKYYLYSRRDVKSVPEFISYHPGVVIFDSESEEIVREISYGV